jgi:hypothetical protein
VTNLIIALAALVAVGPAAWCALRLARRYRRIAFAAASLLLLFGVNATVDPPPPPRTESVEPEEEAETDDEPK